MRLNKLGIIITIIVSASVLAFIVNAASTNVDSMQQQGKLAINKTVKEIKEFPENTQDLVTGDVVINGTTIPKPEPLKEKIDTVNNNTRKLVKNIEEKAPGLPKIMKESIGDDYLRQVKISPNSSEHGCEEDITCYAPSTVTLYRGGKVIWTNYDASVHTVTSGNPIDGPNGLFESDLIGPNESYSFDFNTIGEYDYYCVIHPWMAGKIIVSRSN